MTSKFIGVSKTPIAYLSKTKIDPGSKKAHNLSNAQIKKILEKVVVVIDHSDNNKIKMIEGTRALGIRTCIIQGTTKYTQLWPLTKKNNGHNAEEIQFLVLRNIKTGELVPIDGRKATPILNGKAPMGFEIEFNPHQQFTKKKKKS